MKNFFIIGLISIAFVSGYEQYIEDNIKRSILTIQLSQRGFHRDLAYTFDFDKAYNDCEFMLEQHIPSSIYINVDQLDNRKRLNILNSIYPRFVDIEQPTERSHDFDIFLRGKAGAKQTLIMPLHFRYHFPRNESSFVFVDLPEPKIFIYCPKLLKREQNVLTYEEPYCLNIRQSRMYHLKSNNMGNDSECYWHPLSVVYYLKSPLSVKIPIGNRWTYLYVCSITITVSWIITILIIIQIHHLTKRIKTIFKNMNIQ